MSKKGIRFPFRDCVIMGFVIGVIVAGIMVLERGCSILLSVLCIFGGGLAGVILFTLLIAYQYVMSIPRRSKEN